VASRSSVARWRLTTLNSRLQEKVWDRRASTWDHHGAAGLEDVVEAVLSVAEVPVGGTVVDLGCGTGQLSIPLAQRGAHVTAVDVSREMIDRLVTKAPCAGPGTVTGLVSPVEELSFAPGSVDLVVSNYALHHLRDSDKRALVQSAACWLVPGGRIVIGDMMFGRGVTARDRAIIASKVAILVRRGPAGCWRVVKNLGRFAARFQERPVPPEKWVQYLEGAGFEDVAVHLVVSEAAVVMGTRPPEARMAPSTKAPQHPAPV